VTVATNCCERLAMTLTGEMANFTELRAMLLAPSCNTATKCNG
jgi:hypothetical protein